MHMHRALPRARRDGLLEERIGEELLLYDQSSHVAHCLSPIAARVWRQCDGEHDVAGLSALAGVGEALIADALHELRESDLLDTEPKLAQGATPGESRRETIGRIARYGAAAAAGSMVVSATAATPAMASSGSGCTSGSSTCCDCRNNVCHEGTKSAAECEKICETEGSKEFQFVSGGASCA
jgi:hypothetical protein